MGSRHRGVCVGDAQTRRLRIARRRLLGDGRRCRRATVPVRSSSSVAASFADGAAATAELGRIEVVAREPPRAGVGARRRSRAAPG